MGNSNTTNSNLRQSAGDVRVNPSQHTWKQLSARLDAHRAEQRLRWWKILGYSAAAGFLVLITAAIVILGELVWSPEEPYVDSIESLQTSNNIEEGIYTVASVREVNNSVPKQY